jgi:DNA-binding response OmpR family regulator/anti-sigma regulatory factor (Ser/Thr protein kinase)
MTASAKQGDILIIDDTPDNLRFLSDLLSKAGYTVRRVINGELGLEAAQLQPPDLILLDIKMPGLDGYRVCDQLKTSRRTQQIPVIFLSAMDEELDKVMAFEAGAVDYITKPFQVVEVLARIENHLQVSRLRQALQQQNAQLQRSIEQRTSAETALAALNHDLETQIRQRTAELQAQNEVLLNSQTELQHTLAQAQFANQLKTQTISTLTQKLRPALTRITTAVEQLQKLRPDRSAPETQALQVIVENSQLMTQLLREALTLTETKQPIGVNLTEFCRAFVQQWKLPDTPQYQLSFVSWGKSPGLLQLDTVLLQQMFSHLLSNAIRYAPQGGTILFQLTYQPTEISIQIRDEGSGIPAAELEHLLNSASAVAPASTLTGANLALAKQLAEGLGGTITIHSEINVGTTATLSLPILPYSS